MAWPGQTASRQGFTLVELLIAIAILGALIALLLPILSAAMVQARKTATQAMLSDLHGALEMYAFEHNGSYPLRPGSAGRVLDDGSGRYDPGFIQVPCAAVGSRADGSEDAANIELMKRLVGARRLGSRLDRRGRLCDSFGSPVVVRFLVLPPNEDGDTDVNAYCWSYGQNRANDTHASLAYANLGAPVYDKVESQTIDTSPDSDDIAAWK